MNKKLISQNIVLIIIVALIAIIPLMLMSDEEFLGTDDAASELIEEMNEEFEPWVEPIISLPGEETEGLLFALQAALGAGVLCYFIGYLKGRREQNTTKV